MQRKKFTKFVDRETRKYARCLQRSIQEADWVKSQLSHCASTKSLTEIIPNLILSRLNCSKEGKLAFSRIPVIATVIENADVGDAQVQSVGRCGGAVQLSSNDILVIEWATFDPRSFSVWNCWRMFSCHIRGLDRILPAEQIHSEFWFCSAGGDRRMRWSRLRERPSTAAASAKTSKWMMQFWLSPMSLCEGFALE